MNEDNDETGGLAFISSANFFLLISIKFVLTFAESCYNKHLTI